jgi:hypothetical protein
MVLHRPVELAGVIGMWHFAVQIARNSAKSNPNVNQNAQLT